MKKIFSLLLIAAIGLFSSVALSSCGDDEEGMIAYTLSMKAVKGSLSDEKYELLCEGNNEETVHAQSDSEAKSKLIQSLNTYRPELIQRINELAQDFSAKDFGYDISLTRQSSGKVIYNEKLRPTI